MKRQVKVLIEAQRVASKMGLPRRLLGEVRWMVDLMDFRKVFHTY